MARVSLFVILTTLLSYAYGAHFEFIPKGKKEPCILMDADFSIKLDAVKSKKVVQSITLTSEKPKFISVTGKCEPSPFLKLEFHNGVAWSLDFKKPNETVFMNRQIQFVPNKVFSPNTTKLAGTLTFIDPLSWQFASANESFLCKAQITTTYHPKAKIPGPMSFTVTNTIRNFKIQAFDVNNGKYSPSHECSQDFKSSTTPAPTTTTTIPPPPDNSYYVTNKNVTCIALTGKMSVDIRYEKKTSKGEGMGNIRFDIPSVTKASGSCHLTNDTQNLVITFFNNWSVEMIFEKDTAKMSSVASKEDTKDYRIQGIILTYVIDHTRFPGSVLPEGHVVKVNATGDEYKFPHKSLGKGFYLCKSAVDLMLNDNTTLTTSDFHFKAFNDDSNRNFTGSAAECAADKSSSNNNHLAIILGAAAGGLALIIIIVVIVILYKKKRKPHYESLQ